MIKASMGAATVAIRHESASRRRPLVPCLVVLAGTIAAVGCVRNESTTPANDPQGARRFNDAAPRNGSATRLTPVNVETTDALPAAAPDGIARTLTAGTTMTARLDTTLDSSVANVGDGVQATLITDVLGATGAVVFPAGTVLSGKVTDVQPARKVHKMASLAFRFDRATLPDGTTAAISASEGANGKGWTKKQGAIIGGSAAGGALLGQILGKDTESTVGGAIVGGAIATGVIMSHKGEDIVISSGSTLDLALDGDVTVMRPGAL